MSLAISPVSPLAILPGIWLNASQTEKPFPPSSHPPSTWYEEVEVPNLKSAGKVLSRIWLGTGTKQ